MMPCYQLDDELWFPPTEQAEDYGLLAVGGDLSPDRLLMAYSLGVFPWYNPGESILWWAPDPRCVLFPSELQGLRSHPGGLGLYLFGWGVLMTFAAVPVLTYFFGKRWYCSWVCGCGGLAETLGDRWRHLAPKGKESVRWERMNLWVLVAASVVTVMMLTRDVITIFGTPADVGLDWYHLIADVWLVGILPVTLYPFFGGKVWCRYWCPLAKMMQIFSSIYTRFRISRFAIHSNDKCIACGECSRNCQVGIDVMGFALKQEELNSFNTSCIGCGICVTVCPMDTLSFQPASNSESQLVHISSVQEGANL